MCLVLWPGLGSAAGDDPLVTHPDVLIVFDNSGSMRSCGLRDASNTCLRSRFTAAQEVLTGTFDRTIYRDPLGRCPTQGDDGILDTYKGMLRFGLGSFDCENCLRYGGNWRDAYGDDVLSRDGNYWIGGRGLKGRSGSDTVQDRCKSSRGGCLVDVIDSTDPSDLLGNNVRVQNTICDMVWEGCTPLAASLHDARKYFENYESELGYSDPLGRHAGDCRPQFVLLMTDGQEYPSCGVNFRDQGWGGNYHSRCSWYGNEAMQAERLWKMGVPVYVVAFGNMGSWQRRVMHRIARAGQGLARSEWLVSSGDLKELETVDGTKYDEPKAFIVEDPASLKVAFSIILDSILAGSLSRTVSATTPSSAFFDTTYEVSSWFEMGITGITWNGFLALSELKDTDGDGSVELVSRKVVAWDRYLPDAKETLVPLPAPSERRFLTVVEDPRSKGFHDAKTYSLPRYENSGKSGLVPFKATGSSDSSEDFDHSRMCLVDTGEGLSEDEHARLIKAYVRGEGGIKAASGLRVAVGSQLGDIFHSSPQIVPPPTALAPNFRFEVYFQEYRRRHSMIYVGANDGLLHAFVAEDNDSLDGQTEVLSELWAFMPNRVLSTIQRMRSSGHTFYVDGTPVVRHVFFHNMHAPDGDPSTNVCLKDAKGSCVKGAYRTVLIAGQRAGGDAYFALDVSDPDNPGYLWEYRTGMPTDDGNNSTHFDDYEERQCQASSLQTWAEPIVGQLWLKDGNTATYMSKSVAIVPGGYMPKLSLGNLTSCVQLVSSAVSSNTLHILDVETGELLRKMVFTDMANIKTLETELGAYYNQLEATPKSQWNKWGAQDFRSGDYNRTSGDGWRCEESRTEIQTPPEIPAGLLVPPVETSDPDFSKYDFCDVAVDTGGIAYQRWCCSDADKHKCANMNANNACLYKYTEYKNGDVEVLLKTDGCYLVNAHRQGKFHVWVGRNFTVESSAATPVAYNTSLGEYLSRLFVVSTRGKVWRVDVANAQYEKNADEGQRIVPHHDDANKDWSVSLWFDPTDSTFMGTKPVQPNMRPVTVTPSLALNYRRNLVLFYGTGSIDDLEYKPGQKDYFYAVEEVRKKSDPTQFEKRGELVDQITSFDDSERLFGKPLIVGGRVFFLTYLPQHGLCQSGVSRVYDLDFEDFDRDGAIVHKEEFKKKAKGPSLRWIEKGAEVSISANGKTEIINSIQILQVARPMFWGKVL
jgi:hypothetical protein